MTISNLMFYARHRRAWSNPERKIQTLESFAQTEMDAGKSILSALPYVDNPKLRKHLERHAKDELEHGHLFNTQAHKLRKLQPNSSSIYKKPDKLYNLSRIKTSTELNSHDFFSGENYEKLGEITYVAMLNVAEAKAEKIFSKHHKLLHDDPETFKIFERILKDERYHVSYTGKFLAEWKNQGKTKQVKKALSFAKKARLFNSIKRKSSILGEKMGHLVLYILYFTIVVPFVISSKLSRSKKGWQYPEKLSQGLNQGRSQY